MNRNGAARAIKRNAERKAKHDAPYAARVLGDPQTFAPITVRGWTVKRAPRKVAA